MSFILMLRLLRIIGYGYGGSGGGGSGGVTVVAIDFN